MRPLDVEQLEHELASLEVCIANLRNEAAEGPEHVTPSMSVASEEMYDISVRIFALCRDDDGDPSGDQETAREEEAYPEDEGGFDDRTLGFWGKLWHRHINRWFGPSLAFAALLALVGALIYYMILDVVEGSSYNDTYTYP